MSDPAWWTLLDADEQALIDHAGFGLRVGLGDRPLLLVIDVQNFMVGAPDDPEADYPSACRDALPALPRITRVIEAARTAAVPIVYTQNQFRRDRADVGVYARKRQFLEIDGWCLEGSTGARIHQAVQPAPGDIVLVKQKPSAFMGTPLLALLLDRQVDTLIVVGGSTANCVRATTVDAASYNYRTTVVEDCVFDRFTLSHLAALFDLQRQYADVLASADVLAYFEQFGHPNDRA